MQEHEKRSEDVHALEPTMTLADANGLLELIDRKADASHGLSWDTLTYYISAYKAALMPATP